MSKLLIICAIWAMLSVVVAALVVTFIRFVPAKRRRRRVAEEAADRADQDQPARAA
jgi:flagellar biosynthesis/type III secretory pathway M-ring protein FliF/YscJ